MITDTPRPEPVAGSEPVAGPEKPRHIDERITRISDRELIEAFGAPAGVTDMPALRRWAAGRIRDVAWPLGEWVEQAHGTAEATAVIAAADALLADDFDVTGADQGRSQRYGWHYLGWLAGGIKAWLLTGDPARLRAVDRHLVRWAETRDSVVGEWPGLDVIWYSLGTWARCHNLLPALPALTTSELSDRAWRDLVATLVGGGRWAHDEHDRFRHGNWQLVSATALIELAAVLPDLVEAPAWDRRGRERLLEHLVLDVYPDGGHYERSPGYHRMCVEAVQTAAVIDQRYGDGELARHPRVRAMHDWLVTLTGPGGWIPHLQDSPVVWPADVLRRGGRLLDAPELIRAADDPRGLDRPGAELLPDSGYVVLRAGADLRAVINIGPHIEHELESHSHRAVTDLVLDGWGRPLLWEAGGPVSYDVADYLTWFQSGRGHNCVTVGDAELSVDRGARLLGLWDCDPVAAVAMRHHGYGPTQHREVIMVRQDPVLIVVRDRAGDGGSSFSCRWHGVAPWRQDGPVLSSATGDGPRLRLAVLDEPGVEQTVRFTEGTARRPDPATGTADHAPLYGIEVERPVGTFTTVLAPTATAAEGRLDARADGAAVEVLTDDLVDRFEAAGWVRRTAAGTLLAAAAWAGADLVVDEFAVRQRDPGAGTLSTISATGDDDGVNLHVTTTGRAGLRLTGMTVRGSLSLNGIGVDPHFEGGTLLIGLPMAGDWRIAGLRVADPAAGSAR